MGKEEAWRNLYAELYRKVRKVYGSVYTEIPKEPVWDRDIDEWRKTKVPKDGKTRRQVVKNFVEKYKENYQPTPAKVKASRVEENEITLIEPKETEPGNKVVLIDGYRVPLDNVMGHCTFPLHPGGLYRIHMEKHKCLEKRCTALQDPWHRPWKHEEKIRDKGAAKALLEYRRLALQEVLEAARKVLNKCENIHVTSAKYGKAGRVEISYIYDKFVDIGGYAEMITNLTGISVILKPVKAPKENIKELIIDRKKN
jgi:hypothetical protein